MEEKLPLGSLFSLDMFSFGDIAPFRGMGGRARR